MSELETLNIKGACGDELFHKDPNNPDGPIYIICTAHDKDKGLILDKDSILTEDTETTESLPCQDRLKVLGGYSVQWCHTCTMNPKARETGHFNNIGGAS